MDEGPRGIICIQNNMGNCTPNDNVLLMEEIQLTTWDVRNLANNGINYLSTGAGFLPSTVPIDSMGLIYLPTLT